MQSINCATVLFTLHFCIVFELTRTDLRSKSSSYNYAHLNNISTFPQLRCIAHGGAQTRACATLAKNTGDVLWHVFDCRSAYFCEHAQRTLRRCRRRRLRRQSTTMSSESDRLRGLGRASNPRPSLRPSARPSEGLKLCASVRRHHLLLSRLGWFRSQHFKWKMDKRVCFILAYC